MHHINKGCVELYVTRDLSYGDKWTLAKGILFKKGEKRNRGFKIIKLFLGFRYSFLNWAYSEIHLKKELLSILI